MWVTWLNCLKTPVRVSNFGSSFARNGTSKIPPESKGRSPIVVVGPTQLSVKNVPV